MKKVEIKNFKRLELKYLLTLEQKSKLLNEFKEILVPDTNWNETWKYKLESIYYDTDDLKFYYDKIARLRNKKLRIRRYVEEGKKFDENSLVFVEIKEKINWTTEKRRVKMSYLEAINFIEKWKLPNFKEEDKKVVEEVFILASENKLKPKAITSYDRQAFFGIDEKSGLRLTFDTSVAYKKNNLVLNTNTKDGNIISSNLTIMELKANEVIPEYMLKFFERNNITPTNMSKYCQAIEETERNSQNLDYDYHKNENLVLA